VLLGGVNEGDGLQRGFQNALEPARRQNLDLQTEERSAEEFGNH
jgi:hypothetical protein